jgi:hypothetical protein
LKIYLFNNNSQVLEIEEILPTGAFDKNFLIYPKEATGSGPARNASSIADAGGYVLNLETRSFGRIPSENLLSKVEFYPVDSNYLQTFEGYSPGQSRMGIQNNLKVLDVKKFGTWGYRIEINGSGLLELGQGYDKGWVGFTIKDYRLKIIEHTKVNSWANGWTIQNSTISNLNSIIYIVYWPQLLEWGGGFLGLVTLLVLIF